MRHTKPVSKKAAKKRVYRWSRSSSVLVIAKSSEEAASILRIEYGCPIGVGSLRLYRGPFEVRYQNDGESFRIKENEFVRKVATYAGGIVCQD